jgi:hypothetical protein
MDPDDNLCMEATFKKIIGDPELKKDKKAFLNKENLFYPKGLAFMALSQTIFLSPIVYMADSVYASWDRNGPISEITRLIASSSLSKEKFSSFYQEIIITSRNIQSSTTEIYYADYFGNNRQRL